MTKLDDARLAYGLDDNSAPDKLAIINLWAGFELIEAEAANFSTVSADLTQAQSDLAQATADAQQLGQELIDQTNAVVTLASDVADNAAAAASSASAAEVTKTEVETVASAVEQDKIDAEAASASASATESAVVTARDDALGAAATATAASEVAVDASRSATDFQRILDGTAAVDEVSAGATITDGSAVLGQDGFINITTSSGPGHAGIIIPTDKALQFGGQKIRVDILARASTATQFQAIYITNDVGNSGQKVFSATSDWEWYSFSYTVPAPIAGGTDFLQIEGDAARSGLSTDFARVVVRLAATAGDIPEIGALQASATLQQTAIANINGKLASSLSLRAIAGDAKGTLEVIASDDPTGSATSGVRIKSDIFSANYVPGVSGILLDDTGLHVNENFFLNGDLQFLGRGNILEEDRKFERFIEFSSVISTTSQSVLATKTFPEGSIEDFITDGGEVINKIAVEVGGEISIGNVSATYYNSLPDILSIDYLIEYNHGAGSDWRTLSLIANVPIRKDEGGRWVTIPKRLESIPLGVNPSVMLGIRISPAMRQARDGLSSCTHSEHMGS